MSTHAMPRPHPLVRVLLTITFSRPYVEVTRDALVVRLGWSFRAVVPRTAITSVDDVAGRRWSIGAHGWGGRWLVNTANSPLVRITVDPATRGRLLGVPVQIRELTLSIADVDAFAADLR